MRQWRKKTLYKKIVIVARSVMYGMLHIATPYFRGAIEMTFFQDVPTLNRKDYTPVVF